MTFTVLTALARRSHLDGLPCPGDGPACASEISIGSACVSIQGPLREVGSTVFKGNAMSKIKKAAQAALVRGRDTAVRVGTVAKSTTVVAAKAGAAAAVVAGSREFARGWKESRPDQVKVRKQTKVIGILAGAAALIAVGAAIGRSRAKKDV